MTRGLKRYQSAHDLHFITFSWYHRKPYLGSSEARNLFVNTLEQVRQSYGFYLSGFVVMPEHVHLLISEPGKDDDLAVTLKALKVSVTKQRPFWQARYYDFNVFTEPKRIEKLKYMHRNPVTRGLVEQPEDWIWSSFRHYLTGEPCGVEVESHWTGASREVKDPR